MTASWLKPAGLLIGTLAATVALHAQPPVGETQENVGTESTVRSSKAVDEQRVSVAVARDRAQLMHDIYASTLDMMHHRYFRGDRAMVPARAMEDVFSEIQRKSQTEAWWISVNLKPMSLDHAPKTNFEKQAARALATGKSEIEAVKDGYYHRAVAIPLTAGCISCHGGFFRAPSKTPKFAGLVISVPIHIDSEKAK